MIFSHEKAQDMRKRIALLEFMQESLLLNCPVTARYAGLEAKRLGDRITSHDYTQDEALRAKYPHIDFELSTPQQSQKTQEGGKILV